MLKSQYLIIAVSIMAIAGLAFMPKVVVENDATTNMTESKEPQHQSEPSLGNSTEIESAIASFTQADAEIEKKEALDKLIDLFKEANSYDSAAYYAGNHAETYPSEENLFLAADLYYQAFTFSLDQEKTRAMGEKGQYFLNKTLEETPNNLEAKVMLGVITVSTQSPMAGIRMITEVLEIDPNNEMALFQLGLFSIQSGQYDKAVIRFNKLVSLDGDNLQARYYLGMSYKELGQKERAIEQLTIVQENESAPQIKEAVEAALKELQQ